MMSEKNKKIKVKLKGVRFFREMKGFIILEIILDFRTLLCLA